VSVIIPTYRRSRVLVRCLGALELQTQVPAEVIVVVRAGDEETMACLGTLNLPHLPVRVAKVDEAGAVAAYNAGLAASTGDVIAFTDDDAEPHRDWVERLARHFQEDERVGGVGGRDRLSGTRQVARQSMVGRVRWWGRWFGAHHLGTGAARDVEALKGVNMSYRRSAIAGQRFDTRLKGVGAQEYCDTEFSLRLGRAGWRLVYDPQLVVDHNHAPRRDYSHRTRFNPQAAFEFAHNETLVLLEHLSPLRRGVFLAWALLVGTRKAPGLIQWIRFLLQRERFPGQRVAVALRGRMEGWRTWRNQAQ
jgi:GT2 family glycosyltransferase